MQSNQKRDFDQVAAIWDQEPRRVKLAQEVVAAMLRELPLTPEMEALDFGCGSGLVTLGLQPHVGRITGADSSRGMLEVLKGKLQQQEFDNVSFEFLDLEKEQLPASYGLIVSSMTLHHVQDVPALIRSLVQALKPGGWLALADLESEDGSFHDNMTGVLHHGFSRELLLTEYAANGLSELRAVQAAVMEKNRPGEEPRSYPVLLWLGRKPI